MFSAINHKGLCLIDTTSMQGNKNSKNYLLVKALLSSQFFQQFTRRVNQLSLRERERKYKKYLLVKASLVLWMFSAINHKGLCLTDTTSMRGIKIAKSIF
jgi:hypothetical protein